MASFRLLTKILADFPKLVYIWRGLCRDTPKLIYINVKPNSQKKLQPYLHSINKSSKLPLK